MKWLYEQDKEDFEQEQLIKEWLGKKKRPIKWEAIDYLRQHFGRKGSARYEGVVQQRSLQKEINEDSTGTLEDFIVGCDGRDSYRGADPTADEFLDAYFYFLNFDEETTEWLIKTLKSSLNLKQLHLETYPIDSEW